MMSEEKQLLAMYLYSARSNENEIDLIAKYGQQRSAILPNLPAEIFRGRAVSCWGAAVKLGLVVT